LSHSALLAKLRDRKTLDDEIKGELARILPEAKERFRAERGRA
jgi:hypothetical protein